MTGEIEAAMRLEGSDTPAFQRLVAIMIVKSPPEEAEAIMDAWTKRLREISDEAHQAVQRS